MIPVVSSLFPDNLRSNNRKSHSNQVESEESLQAFVHYCYLLKLHWLFKFLSKLTHFAQNRYRNVGCYICSAFNCPAQPHNMDNRFSPAEREAWIIVLNVNTGDA